MGRNLKYWLIYTFVCPVAYGLLRLYKHLVRYRNNTWQYDAEISGFGPGIYVQFHSKLFVATLNHIEALKQGRTVTVELSPSRDGEILARIARLAGMRVVRGSRKKNRIGSMRAILRELEEGRSLALALDGPRGPKGSVSDAILHLARRTGRPLIPFHARATRKWTLRSWDRHEIPKPFSRVEGVYLPPIYIPRDADDAALEAIKQRLRSELNEECDRDGT